MSYTGTTNTGTVNASKLVLRDHSGTGPNIISVVAPTTAGNVVLVLPSTTTLDNVVGKFLCVSDQVGPNINLNFASSSGGSNLGPVEVISSLQLVVNNDYTKGNFQPGDNLALANIEYLSTVQPNTGYNLVSGEYWNGTINVDPYGRIVGIANNINIGLNDLNDINISNISNGDLLVWNSSANAFLPTSNVALTSNGNATFSIASNIQADGQGATLNIGNTQGSNLSLSVVGNGNAAPSTILSTGNLTVQAPQINLISQNNIGVNVGGNPVVEFDPESVIYTAPNFNQIFAPGGHVSGVSAFMHGDIQANIGFTVVANVLFPQDGDYFVKLEGMGIINPSSPNFVADPISIYRAVHVSGGNYTEIALGDFLITDNWTTGNVSGQGYTVQYNGGSFNSTWTLLGVVQPTTNISPNTFVWRWVENQ